MKDPLHWLQILLPFAPLILLIRPVGRLLAAVADPGGRTPFDPLLRPVERFLYRLAGIRARDEQGWRLYAFCLLSTAALGVLLSSLLLSLQDHNPLEPDAPFGLPLPRAIATALAIVANAAPDAFAPSLSQGSLLLVLGFQGLLTGAIGLAAGAAVLRVVARPGITTVGSFWVDLTRATLHVIFPLALLLALAVLLAGIPQELRFGTPQARAAVDPAAESVGAIAPPAGPVASQKALAALTGGAALHRRAGAQPDPVPLALALALATVVLPLGYLYAWGIVTRDRAHGRALWAPALALLLLLAALACGAERGWTARPRALGLDPAPGNLEGKDARAGVAASAFSATLCAASSNGSPNCDPKAFTPLGGAVLAATMGTWGALAGSTGPSLALILAHVLLAAAMASVLSGGPQLYAGRRFGIREVALSVAVVCAPTALALGTLIWLAPGGGGDPAQLRAALLDACSIGTANGMGLANAPGGPGKMLISAVALFAARYLPILLLLALCGTLARGERPAPETPRPRLAGAGFAALVLASILLFGLLPLLPAILSGPIRERIAAIHRP